MIKVEVNYDDYSMSKTIYEGVVGFQVGTSAIDMTFYNMEQLLIPLWQVSSVKRTILTDAEILNHEDTEYANWYAEKKAAFDAEKEEGGLTDAKPH